jgi:hypothetical protein
MAGWIAWLQRRPRGERRADVLMALQTAHLLSAWVEGEHHPQQYLPPWKDVQETCQPQNEAEALLSEFGMTQRLASLNAG